MTSMNVTAIAGGFTVNGLLLRVDVLTGAASSQPGGTGAAAGKLNPAAVHVTTTQAGSVVLGAILFGGPGTAFTALAGTTLDDNVSDAPNARLYGSCRTALTTSPGLINVGSSAPHDLLHKRSAAVAEILADLSGPGLAFDSSSPAGAVTKTDTTVSTASFDPPAGSLLVASVAANGGDNSLVTMNVTGGGTWAPLAQAHPSGYFYTGVWALQL